MIKLARNPNVLILSILDKQKEGSWIDLMIIEDMYSEKNLIKSVESISIQKVTVTRICYP